jgi:hypothetical protein
MVLLRLLTIAALMGEVYEGYAPHYGKGLMARVAARRGLPAVGCMVSSPRFPIGTYLYVYGVNTGALRYCKVVDVSAPKDSARHLRTRREIEIAYENTIDLCGSTKTRVTDCPILVIKLEE